MAAPPAERQHGGMTTHIRPRLSCRRTLPAALAGSLLALVAACSQPIETPQPETRVAEVAAKDTVLIYLYLIGDAGAPDPRGEPVLKALGADLASRTSGERLVIYLGDNIYMEGMPDSSAGARAIAERRLAPQVDVLKPTKTKGVFVPGNHDWDNSGPDGWAAVRRAEKFVLDRADGLAIQAPADGCPGPVAIDVAKSLRVIMLDTEWWLRQGPKPRADSKCASDTEAAIVRATDSLLAGAEGRRVVIASHHPMLTGGPHAGAGDHEDVGSPPYRHMRERLVPVFDRRKPMLVAAGHDHSLQVIHAPGGWPQLVSGAGIYGHTSGVRTVPGMKFGRSVAGYARLDMIAGGRSRLSVVSVNPAGQATEAYAEWLEPPPTAPDSSARAPRSGS